MKIASATVYATRAGDFLEVTVGYFGDGKVLRVPEEKLFFEHSKENGAFNTPQNREKYYTVYDIETLLEMAEKGVFFSLN